MSKNALAMVEEKAITNFDELSHEELAKLAGVSKPKGDYGLPKLRINRDFDDEAGNQLQPGTWAVYDPKLETTVYGKSVIFRPFMFKIQYRQYDPKGGESGNGAWVNQTILFGDWSDEPFDELGTLRCGKPQGRVFKTLSDDEKARYDDINCYRIVFGLATIKGQTADGTKATAEEVPCVWYARGSNWTPASDLCDTFKKGNRLPWLYEVTMTLKREKNGATTYYVAQTEVDLNKPRQFVPEDAELLKSVAQYVVTYNKEVYTKYKQSIRADQANAKARNSAAEVEVIDPDADLSADFAKDELNDSLDDF